MAMFGLVESDGLEWSGVGYKHIPLFVFVKYEWNGMEYDGTHSIQYHSFFQFFIPSNLGCIQWNGIYHFSIF
jgi:hypothetical protein